ncbi:MAG TPA: LLM class F420-dependent oxidoreductase [Dehalococcoidia bacterium]|nr:LLM class F420-dependent oxidoreductase [Dehalococcoidia bacterium]
MKPGVSMFVTDYSIGAAELGRAAEDQGFESLFVPEHTHIPTSRRSPWPGGPNLPEEYLHSLDPFLALAAAAAVTRDLRLGTGICLVIERDPITLAKEVATLDFISGGRVLFGIGGGWNYEEMQNHGTKPSLRWKILRERILAMKEIWTHDEAQFHGECVDFDPIWQWPKPVQKPHPPILIGGDGPRTFQRVIEYGDAWLPIMGRSEVPLSDKIAELNRLAREAGRGPVPVTVFGARAEPKLLEEYQAAGVERVVVGVRPAPAEQVLPDLRRYADMLKSFA